MVGEQNPAGGGGGGDVDTLGDYQTGAVLEQGFQGARSFVELTAACIVASENNDSDPFGHCFVDKRQGVVVGRENFVGVQLKDESGELELGPLVAAGEEGSRRWGVGGAGELLVEVGGGAIGEGGDGGRAVAEEGERGRTGEEGVAWD